MLTCRIDSTCGISSVGIFNKIFYRSILLSLLSVFIFRCVRGGRTVVVLYVTITSHRWLYR